MTRLWLATACAVLPTPAAFLLNSSFGGNQLTHNIIAILMVAGGGAGIFLAHAIARRSAVRRTRLWAALVVLVSVYNVVVGVVGLLLSNTVIK